MTVIRGFISCQDCEKEPRTWSRLFFKYFIHHSLFVHLINVLQKLCLWNSFSAFKYVFYKCTQSSLNYTLLIALYQSDIRIQSEHMGMSECVLSASSEGIQHLKISECEAWMEYQMYYYSYKTPMEWSSDPGTAACYFWTHICSSAGVFLSESTPWEEHMHITPFSITN